MAKEHQVTRRGVVVAKTFSPDRRDELEKERQDSLKDKLDSIDRQLAVIEGKLNYLISTWKEG